jgi:hypothetical protein
MQRAKGADRLDLFAPASADRRTGSEKERDVATQFCG